jgi:transposase
MDNGGAHKSKMIKEAIDNTNNKLLYSVPYRPKTNAIESWFNQFKYHFRFISNTYTFSELKNSVGKSIRQIPKKSYNNYLKYAYNDKETRKFEEKTSNRRLKLKRYKD